MKFVAWVRTDKAGSLCEEEFEVPDEDLDACATDADRDNLIRDEAREVAMEMCDWGFREVSG